MLKKKQVTDYNLYWGIVLGSEISGKKKKKNEEREPPGAISPFPEWNLIVSANAESKGVN